jgi:biopolymer transport protein ExbD
MNVTPLVDIVLVLIVIFLVAMPVALHKLDVDIPVSDGSSRPMAHDEVIVEVKRSGLDGNGHIISVLVDGNDTNRAELADRLHTLLATAHDKIVFVDFDDSTHYSDAVGIIDLARGAGASNVAIRTGR